MTEKITYDIYFSNRKVNNRQMMIDFWYNRYGKFHKWMNKDMIGVAMAIIERGNPDSQTNGSYKWSGDGVEEELIQDYCRILAGKKPLYYDYRRLYKETA